MTPDELTQFQALAKKFEPKDRDAVLQAVKADMHPVFQAAHDEGHSAATQRAKVKETELTLAKTQAEEQLAEANTKLKTLGNGAPDVVQLQARHEQQLLDVKEKAKQKLAEVNQQLQDTRLAIKQQEVINSLVQDQQVDPEYARTVLIKRDDVAKRFKANQAGQVELLQAGKELPITATDELSDSQVLAAELVQGLNQKWLVSKVNRGSGMRGTQGGPGVGGKNKFQQARDEVTSQDKAKDDASRAGRSGLARLGATG